ncbi:MAG: hypothetical protein HQ523_10610 [Lentisphaerae bacterium]|nr:hypothetical protein [Lentisphaerota bacterium]
MSDINEKALQEEYGEEIRTTAFRHGRLLAGVGLLVLSYMFMHDFFVMNVGLLAAARLIGIIPAVVYLVLSFSFLPRRRHLAVPAHITLLSLIMISSGVFSWGLFRSHLEGAAYGAAGTMQASVLAVFVFGNGVRRHLWAIVIVPLALTLMAILICCAPSRVELTLFMTPFITAICVVAAGISQDRMGYERFRMGKQVQQHKDELEDKAEALQLANNELQQFASVVAHDLKVPLHSIQKALEKMDGGGALGVTPGAFHLR